MDQMLESKIKWIGKIPRTWNIYKLKEICEGFSNGTSIEQLSYGESEYPVTRIESISTGKINYEKVGYIEKNLLSYRLKVNDILISNINSIQYLGNCAIYGGEQPLYHGMNLLRIIPTKVNPKYLLHYFKSECFKKNMQIMCKPAINQASVSALNIKNMKIPLPVKEEQELIANFLDSKTDKIEEILKDLNNQIEILNKYKKSLITETITKGLNLNIEMKDSGISWIGKIPQHWEIKKLKYLGTARNGLTYSPDNQVDEGILVLRSSNIQDGKVCLKDNVYVDTKIPANIVLKENDLLICSRNGSRNLIGKNALIGKELEGQTYGAFMCVYRSRYNKFIHYVLNSDIFAYYLSSFLTSTINQLTNANLYSIKMPFTYDEEEQKQIIEFLDKKCMEIDGLIENKKMQIEKMEKYKKSLIYEYITGKKRVKGAEELYG